MPHPGLHVSPLGPGVCFWGGANGCAPAIELYYFASEHGLKRQKPPPLFFLSGFLVTGTLDKLA